MTPPEPEFIACQLCGARLEALTFLHLRSCSGVTYQEYVQRFPEAPRMTEEVRRRRARSPEQRSAQSEKIKARFRTPEGEVTRRQISEAAKRMQASESGKRSQEHLRRLNQDPEQRAARGRESNGRWDSGEARAQVEGWHRENQERSLELIAKARARLTKTTSKLHLSFKEKLEAGGVTGLQTEYRVGWYSVDEAAPDLKAAVEIDGCYWHQCPECDLGSPRGRAATEGTRKTDRTKGVYLRNRGWRILRVWGHEIHRDPAGCVERVRAFLQTPPQEVSDDRP